MTEILTVVAQREAMTLTPAILNQIRNAVRGAPSVILSHGEAADIPLSVPLDQVALRAALNEKPMQRVNAWRKWCSTADHGARVRIALPHLSRHGDHGLSRSRRHAGKRASDGGARKSAHDEAFSMRSSEQRFERGPEMAAYLASRQLSAGNQRPTALDPWTKPLSR